MVKWFDYLRWATELLPLLAVAVTVIAGSASAWKLRSAFADLKRVSDDGSLSQANQVTNGGVQDDREGGVTGNADRTASPIQFEKNALENYYRHALSRANVSFWFSMTFATVGFAVIIWAFSTYTVTDLWGSVLKISSGVVIDAVASLFFVQSTNAQKSMAEFFEKLRLDRLNAEARTLLSEIENSERRDEVRTQLVLKYSAIDKLVVGS